MTTHESAKVLITGGGGMVGGNIADHARKSGWQVFTPSSADLDLRDVSLTLEYLKDQGIGSIIHCAARVGGIAANIAAPADFILNNLQIDSSIISSARKLKVQKFIYFGSSCMYPRDISQPMGEEKIMSAPLEPTNEGYALAKIAGAKSVESVAKQDSLDWKVLIPSNLYGPRDNFDEFTSHLIPAVIRKIAKAKTDNTSSIEIWGDGQARREFTYVSDVADFIVKNFGSITDWPGMMNIGFGTDHSIDEYYGAIGKELGFKGSFTHNLEKPVGMKRKLMDSAVAKRYGWNPQTDLQTGIAKTVAWYLESLNK
jgi:GDP-L-fucose synthase